MKLEQHQITSSCGEYSRDIWFLPGPPNLPHRLCVFLEGEYYLRDMECVPVIEELVVNEAIPPVTCLFVSHATGEARHRDYTCNEAYTRFVADDVVSWAKGRNERLTIGDSLICGLSLGGLASAYSALQYPSVFSCSLSQPGSFWWLEGRDITLPRTRAKFWLSVGDEETAIGISHSPTGLFQAISQVNGVKKAVTRLKALGAVVRYNEYSGGHAMALWRDEFPLALTWLIGRTA